MKTKKKVKKKNVFKKVKKIKRFVEKQKRVFIWNANNIKLFQTIGIKPSYVERRLIRYFKKHNINFFREVSFDGNYKRFDFYLPEYNALVEYDSVLYHDTISNMLNDNDKRMLAKNNGLDIITLTSEDLSKLSDVFNKQNTD